MYGRTHCLLALGLLVCFAFHNYLEGAVSPILNATPIHEAFVPKFTDADGPAIIAEQPPAPLQQSRPPQPATDHVWIPGYWAWSDIASEYRWVCGVWRRPPPGKLWINGEWLSLQGGWGWRQGFWSTVPQDQLTHIELQPPAAIDDKVPAAPGQNQFWIPGYWSYTAASNQYIWLSGTWSPFNASWVLAPASYVWTPQGFVFNPLYWDHPLDQRGQAYSCQETGTLVVILPGVILQELLYCYPDYLSLYWHWWHFHPGWWDGCWCLPPWWGWSGWWIFPWADLWGLWWWWSHPGFFPPWWLALELAQEIAPPPEAMIDFMKGVPKPSFPFTPGDTLFPPQGPQGQPPTTRPPIPNDVTPGGKVPTPPFPSTPGTTVTPPPLPPPTQTPPTTPPRRPPPQQTFPTEPYYPPTEVNPPDYYPDYPQYPPRRPYPPVQPRNPPKWPKPPRPPQYDDDKPPSTRPPGGRTPGYHPDYFPGTRTPDRTPDYTPPNTRTPNYTPNIRTPKYSPSITPNMRTPNITPNYTPNMRSPNYTPPSSKGKS